MVEFDFPELNERWQKACAGMPEVEAKIDRDCRLCESLENILKFAASIYWPDFFLSLLPTPNLRYGCPACGERRFQAEGLKCQECGFSPWKNSTAS